MFGFGRYEEEVKKKFMIILDFILMMNFFTQVLSFTSSYLETSLCYVNFTEIQSTRFCYFNWCFVILIGTRITAWNAYATSALLMV